jgi:hypothetical protein
MDVSVNIVVKHGIKLMVTTVKNVPNAVQRLLIRVITGKDVSVQFVKLPEIKTTTGEKTVINAPFAAKDEKMHTIGTGVNALFVVVSILLDMIGI